MTCIEDNRILFITIVLDHDHLEKYKEQKKSKNPSKNLEVHCCMECKFIEQRHPQLIQGRNQGKRNEMGSILLCNNHAGQYFRHVNDGNS